MKGVVFHQDNTPAQKSVVAMAAGFELVDHLPYSPDLAPSDYFLFPNMKKQLAGKQFGLMMRSYLQLRTFLRIRMLRASIPGESKRCNIDGKSVWTAGDTTLKNKHLVKFDHFIIVYELFSRPSYTDTYKFLNKY